MPKKMIFYSYPSSTKAMPGRIKILFNTRSSKEEIKHILLLKDAPKNYHLKFILIFFIIYFNKSTMILKIKFVSH